MFGENEMGRAVNRQPGLPPGKLSEQTWIDKSEFISIFSRIFEIYQLNDIMKKFLRDENN